MPCLPGELSSRFCERCGALRNQANICDSCGLEIQVSTSASSGIIVTRGRDHPSRFQDKAEETFKERSTVKEECPKCHYGRMAFHTAQLRSADEGQTIFYECLKCKYKFSQNS
eukprot:Rmarinus@m.16494